MEKDDRMRLRLSGSRVAGRPLIAHELTLQDIDTGKVLYFCDISLHADVSKHGMIKVTATFFPDELNIVTVTELAECEKAKD